ncbi:DUF6192 family protein [Streptomyces sp. MCAF7]
MELLDLVTTFHSFVAAAGRIVPGLLNHPFNDELARLLKGQ